MRRTSFLVMALAMLLGLAQCKKDQPLEPQGGQVRITLDVNNGSNGGRVDVTGPKVTFTQGDQILVASQGAFVGTLTHNGTNFSGDITDPVEGEPLYFYFLGNKAPKTGAGSDIEVGANTCNVVISDQSEQLPVISMAPSTVAYSTSVASYSARLQNKCSLMKFTATTNANAYSAPISITGMKNKVTVCFADAANDDDNNGFHYDMDGEGVIKMKGVSSDNHETWAIVLQQDALGEGAEGTAYTNGYTGCRPAIQSIDMDQYLDGGIAMTITTEDASKTLNLADVHADYEIQDGFRVCGTLPNDVELTIADGATVTLDNATCNDSGITCLGDATIVLSGTNEVSSNSIFAGLQAGPSGSTLIIQGTGTLTANSSDGGAGIGSSAGHSIYSRSCGNIRINGGTINVSSIGSGDDGGCGDITISGGEVTATGGIGGNCGNITISGGTITATGGHGDTGIGGNYMGNCGDITISGGTITATGGQGTAGIGISEGTCGNITITDGVTIVTAISSRICIGIGRYGECGTITIGGVVYYDGSEYQNDGETYLKTSPLVYQP